MKLTALLNRLPASSVIHLAEQAGLEAAPAGLEDSPDRVVELLNRLSRQLSDPQALEEALGRMKPWMAGVLQAALRRFGPLPFDGPALEKAALEEGYSGAHAKASIMALRRRGLVFGLRKSWGEELYVFPEDTIGAWQRVLFPCGLKEAEPDAWSIGEPCGDPGFAAYDVLHLLDVIRKNKVKPNKQGTLGKPVLRKLEAGLLAKGEELQWAKPFRDNPGGYGPASAAVLDMAIRSGFISVKDGYWAVRTERLMAWFGLPLGRVQRELYRHWMASAQPDAAWQLHALACLEQAAPGRWYRLDHLFEWLRDCGMINRIEDGGFEAFVQACMLPLQAFGWIRLLRLDGGSLAFQTSVFLTEGLESEEPAYSGMIVQPDLEMILPPFPPLELLWDVLHWSQPVSRGRMFVCRLTQDSIRQAAGQGISGKHIADILDRNSRHPVDSRVKDTILEWAGPSLAELPTGTEPPDNGEAALAVEAGRQEETAPPLVLPAQAQDLVYPLLRLPEEETAAEWKSIPAAWWREAGTYHPSTRKEIVRKAVEWKTALTLSDDSGNSWNMIPLSIRETDADWIIEGIRGKERVAVRSREWAGIKLILPGVSE